MKRYKYVLTLPNGLRIDSATMIEGHEYWPNHSQAEPIALKGIFDTYEEASEEANKKEIYKYVILIDAWATDSYEDADPDIDIDDVDDDPTPFGCYLSYSEAETAACEYLGIEPYYPVEQPIAETKERYDEDGNPLERYYFEVSLGDNCCYSSEEDGLIFDTEEEAQEAGDNYADEMEMADIVPIDIVNIEIVEFDDEKE